MGLRNSKMEDEPPPGIGNGVTSLKVASPNSHGKDGMGPHEANHEPELQDTQVCHEDLPKFGTARFGYKLDIGERVYMEDAVEVISNLGDCKTSEYYGVYDGHGGDGAVKFVKSRLSSLVTSQLASKNQCEDGSKNGGDVEQVFRHCFEALDDEYINSIFGRERQHNSSVDRPVMQRTSSVQGGQGLSPGCVACVALVRGSTLYVASIGDCCACLCISHGDEPATCDILTRDHSASAEKNADEHRRVLEEGATVSNDGYLNGNLAVSRAFGDWDYESSQKCVGLICRPDVVQREIGTDTEFLLLASDGIFEKMTPSDAVRTVRRQLRKPGHCNLSDAAEVLVNEAKRMNATDNLSAIVVLFNAPKPQERRTPSTLFGSASQNNLRAGCQ